ECAFGHDREAIEGIAVADDPKTIGAIARDLGFGSKQVNYRGGEEYEHQPQHSEDPGGPSARYPHRTLSPLRGLRSTVLADQRCRSIGKAHDRQKQKEENAHTDLVARDRHASECSYDRYQYTPGSRRHKKLNDRRTRDRYDRPHELRIEPPMLATDMKASVRRAKQAVCRIGNTDTTADDSRQGRTGNTEFRKQPYTEDQQRIKNNIEPVGYHQNAQGDGRVPGPTENSVEQEEKDDDTAGSVHQL